MIGAGFMQHAIDSLKMNRRDKVSIFEKDNSNKAQKTPIELKKASKEKLQALKTERDNLQKRENIRSFFVLIFVLITILIIGFVLLF